MEIEPLSISLDLSGTKTAIPMIQDGAMVNLRLTSLSQVKQEGGPALRFEFDLVDAAPDTDAGQINPGAFGSKVFEQVPLYTKPDSKAQDPRWFEKVIAQRIDAMLGTGDKGNKKGKPERPNLTAQLVPQLIGKTVVAKMGVQNDDRFVGNRIRQTIYPGDIAA